MQLAPGVLRVDTTARAAVLVDSLSALDFPVTGALVGTDGVLRRRVPVDSVPHNGPGLPRQRRRERR
jgi:hypothetical protein